MAGYKRGGFRGGAGGTFKKGGAKKRAGSDDEDSAPRSSKKSKGDEEEEDSMLVVPELKEDDQGAQYIGVSVRHFGLWLKSWLIALKLNASGKRRVTVNEYKSNPLIDIREFWTNNDGELKPGKKVSNFGVLEFSCVEVTSSGHLFDCRPIHHTAHRRTATRSCTCEKGCSGPETGLRRRLQRFEDIDGQR